MMRITVEVSRVGNKTCSHREFYLGDAKEFKAFRRYVRDLGRRGYVLSRMRRERHFPFYPKYQVVVEEPDGYARAPITPMWQGFVNGVLCFTEGFGISDGRTVYWWHSVHYAYGREDRAKDEGDYRNLLIPPPRVQIRMTNPTVMKAIMEKYDTDEGTRMRKDDNLSRDKLDQMDAKLGEIYELFDVIYEKAWALKSIGNSLESLGRGTDMWSETSQVNGDVHNLIRFVEDMSVDMAKAERAIADAMDGIGGHRRLKTA